MIHEQNAFPGLTNRLVAKFVKAIAVAFEDAAPRMKRGDAVVTGNPVRAEFFTTQRPNNPTTRVLIFGGSQGSKILNDAVVKALPLLPPNLAIVHQTGPKMLDEVQRAYGDRPNARVVAYIDPMVDELAAAGIVICRAGAMTIGELAAVGRASILVPFAAATNNHQELNARVMERAGAAIVITERELTPERLAAAVGEIDPQRMGEAAKSLAQPEATKKIVDTVEKII
jgi:UDP-N-acetylglucosamine--N-acetylmuramyl-(pentapeptide) pyrophosphoryl-undecaprenol N-acetylglucosamine transferase